MNAGTWSDIERAIADALGFKFKLQQHSAVGGGCINSAFAVEGSGRRFFVKTNDATHADMFAAEAAGLDELERSRTVRVPQVVCHGSNAEAAWLALEYVDVRPRSGSSDRLLGEQLARMHRLTAARFGWHRDNTIGSTPQHNAPTSDWAALWRDQRLGFQLGLAASRGYRGRLQRDGERLRARVSAFFADYTPQPALLHGDLWSGNAASDASGAPVLYDPAVYYGDREADIAMTQLFGGYSASFYEAYGSAFPLDSGYAVRKDLYNLYHMLNHLNLFGGSYLAQSERMITRLLSGA